MFNIGAFAIIFDKKKRILLCHRLDYDLWNLPGGKVEDKETPWQAVIREVKEETNLKVEVNKVSGIYSIPQKNRIVFSFICKIIGGKIKATEEADKIEYFTFEKIPKNTVPKQVERIKDALLGSDKIFLKIQTGCRFRIILFCMSVGLSK